jgi:hypothetical protein
MPTGIDHIVIAVHDLAQASADYAQAGFTVTPGGVHTDGGTHNALIVFADGAYLELIAFHDREKADGHRWFDAIAGDEGFIAFAVRSADLEDEVRLLRQSGVALGPIRSGGRDRPDGERIKWRSVDLESDPPLPLPFLIEDITPRNLRVPEGDATEHENGARVITGATIVVDDFEATSTAFAALLGPPIASPEHGNGPVRQARRFYAGTHWIDLVEPAEGQSELRASLKRRGAGLYELLLDVPSQKGPVAALLPLTATHGARILTAP